MTTVSLSCVCKLSKCNVLPNENESYLNHESSGCVLLSAEEPGLNSKDPFSLLAVTSSSSYTFFYC